jgi:D-xylose 1-dehydrogenase (NADP+, D-xylono-1,5-lactone-forming)
MTKLRWGILSTADIALTKVIPGMRTAERCEVLAIASRDSLRARAAAAAQGIPRAYDSYEALLADPDVDAVYIPLPNHLHATWAIAAARAGKHVLCEKPLAMNAAEAEAMALAARSAGKHLMEAAMYRFHPRTRDFVEALADPIYVQATFGFTLKGKSNYRFQAALGGGALLDIGFYVVSVARWILGEPSDVFARSRLSGGVDMTTSALLQFSGGRTAAVWASYESPETQELTVVTSEGALRLGRPFNSFDEPDQYQVMVESFADSILDDRPVAIPPSESIANMKVLDRISDAAAR